MATAYLGPQFDIHGGGLDLRFPHHENELAQSRAAGDGFAQLWLHNAWVTQAGEKMSKSLGNTMVVDEVLKRIRGIELRWYLVAAHYRSNIEFSEDALQESGAAFRRIENFVVRADERVGDVDPRATPMCADFAMAMDDDLSTPSAVAAIFELVTEGNRMLALGAKANPAAIRGVLASVRRCLEVLGCDPLAPIWAGSGDGHDTLRDVVDVLVRTELQARADARANKDFAAADAIRSRLADAGIAIEDTSEGPRWSLAGSAE
jgi:cysteinyl-tRNA synthetase